ncbi:spermidine synthase [Legionella maioricensis]|uniref:Fused MFS/spermidine synthase n=1 Tax=Legionella maioricensis TaxID=2896528 RepID=A0A9X2D0N4_9GAMM|nr:fused MFS/spermidine synthase [Legionella maioricensis]MCL9688294.1 fused MFS/spermidine synthase [Legionella maioricensis]
MLRFLFPVSLFLSAVLLFSIQPMVAKTLLPVYGGTPAVWTVCMLFFQFVLLVSYGYVWLLSFFNKPVVWRLVHMILVVLSLIALPLLFHPLSMDAQPEWGILYSLLTQIGLPLLVIGASAPLLQFAYSQTQGKGAADPYFLYIASNLGSLLALILYPWIIERFLGLTIQFHLWSITYFVYIGLLTVILFIARYQPLPPIEKDKESRHWGELLYWVFLSFIPCSLMLGVTLYITTDVAATPLFWVLPLALYLLSFVVTFTTKPLISQAWVIRNYMFFLIFTILGIIIGVENVKAWQLVLFNLLSFFILAVLCHGQLFARRPKPQSLTLFYFCLAIGGVLAGIFNGILAPHLFNQVYEYPLAILLSLLVVPVTKSTRGGWLPLVILALVVTHYFIPTIQGISTHQLIAIIALSLIVLVQQNKSSLFLSMFILFLLIYLPMFNQNKILLQERNFYGVKQVLDKKEARALVSQSTLHGLQFINEKKPINAFRSYYGATKTVVETMEQEFDSMSVTLIGLGIGTMLCQFRNADHVNVIEIDQQVIDIAKNPQLFTYLRDCSPHIEIIKNDGRLALAKIADGSQKLLILDAFNSDSVPVHLMTIEAFTLYKKKIAPDGVILVNLSNRHLDLLPLLNAAGHLLSLNVLSLLDKGNAKFGQFPSEWAVLTANQNLILKLKENKWRSADDKKQFLWTDDYSNIVPLLKLN